MSTISHAIAEYLAGLVSSDIPDECFTTHAPQGIAADHIIVTAFDEDPMNDLTGRSSGLRQREFDIDCHSSDQAQADTILQAVVTALEPYSGALNADWNCQAVILNSLTEAYLPPPADGREVTHYLASADILMQFQPI